MIEGIRWTDDGLVPAIVQDAASGRVLMLGWMNEEALSRTTATGRVHFFSRRRGTLWRKGETSGNELLLRSITADCDGDALLVEADPRGPTCHTGQVSCFFRPLASEPPEPGGPEFEAAIDRKSDGASDLGSVLRALAGIVGERAAQRPEGSYTARLLDAGTQRIAQKVGEEGVEVALAAAAGTDAEVVRETADLLYHLLVLFEDRNLGTDRIAGELSRRFPAARR